MAGAILLGIAMPADVTMKAIENENRDYSDKRITTQHRIPKLSQDGNGEEKLDNTQEAWATTARAPPAYELVVAIRKVYSFKKIYAAKFVI